LLLIHGVDWILTFIFSTIFGIKDIVALFIAFNSDCNQGVDGDDPFTIGLIDLNTWILVTAISHFMMVSVGTLMCCIPNSRCCFECDSENIIVAAILYNAIWAAFPIMVDVFSVSWNVFGSRLSRVFLF